MIFPQSFENKTGFDQIRQMVSDYCLCELGRKWTKKLAFQTAFGSINHELALTEDMRQILLFEENFPEENYIDVTSGLSKIKTEGSYPELTELNDIRKSIVTIKELEHFFNTPENKEKYKTLSKEVSALKYFPFIGNQIDSILDKQGQVKDNASSELRNIRQQIKHKQVQVTRKMQAILKSARQEGLADADAEITLRDGRPVIPVAAGNKRIMNGLVHDESASGKTVFIEPGEVVALNNELRELEYAERREIIKILVSFADNVRPYIDDLMMAYDSLGQIDFLRAKAKLALRINGVKPIIKKTPGMEWRSAVHPLLFLTHSSENKEVIPLHIKLDQTNRILIISGPNAGGKSVCLKTAGLLQYMLQCGLPVPVKENSEFCIFRNIFIDIGDEQSLENDLSTYSSHLLNMKQLIKTADEQTLVLLDEFGAGTEPALGGAIAEAILDEVNSRGSYGVITTHYANLKHFASETPGIINGAMLFDTQKIKPLYQLSIGEPGSSFAIDIARSIGLPEEILKKASEKVGGQYIDYEKHLREIIRDKKYWEEKRLRIRRVERTLDELYDRYNSELVDIQKERKQILAKAKDDAQGLIKEANRNIEHTIREIRESTAQKEKTREVREQLENFRQQMNDKEIPADDYDKKIDELHKAGMRLSKHSHELKEAKVNTRKSKPKVTRELQVGEPVRMAGFDTVGEILEIHGKTFLVAFGAMITSVEGEKLEPAERSGNKSKSSVRTSFSEDIRQRRLNFKPEIDIRGMRGDEAIAKVQEFLDDASFTGISTLKILHGKGNGILQQLVRDYLRTLDFIRTFHDAHADRGGSGITHVELDI